MKQPETEYLVDITQIGTKGLAILAEEIRATLKLTSEGGRDFEEIMSDVGPDIIADRGYGVFKTTYLESENFLRQKISEHAMPGDSLEIDYKVSFDFDLNTYKACHIWRLKRKP